MDNAPLAFGLTAGMARARHQEGESQTAIAKALGVPKQTVNRWLAESPEMGQTPYCPKMGLLPARALCTWWWRVRWRSSKHRMACNILEAFCCKEGLDDAVPG